MHDILKKQKDLISIFGKMNSLMIAYSGGVDSTYLLYEAFKQLKEKVLAVTFLSELIPESEIVESEFFTKKMGIEHIVIPVDILSNKDFVKNTKNRCYICKKQMLNKLLELAKTRNIEKIAHGANTDDFKDFRPGMKAATELGVLSPLIEAGLNKNEIRVLSEKESLITFDKPAMACLASRIPMGEEISKEKLSIIERSESFLKSVGFKKYRVRYYNETAKIETDPLEFNKMFDDKIRGEIIEAFKSYGFKTISIDLEGYKMGCMNN